MLSEAEINIEYIQICQNDHNCYFTRDFWKSIGVETILLLFSESAERDILPLRSAKNLTAIADYIRTSDLHMCLSDLEADLISVFLARNLPMTDC